jgi:hypothetical protein
MDVPTEERNIMKTLSPFVLASVIIAVTGFLPIASAGNPSLRGIEESPAFVRAASPAKNAACKLCALASNSAY